MSLTYPFSNKIQHGNQRIYTMILIERFHGVIPCNRFPILNFDHLITLQPIYNLFTICLQPMKYQLMRRTMVSLWEMWYK